MLVVVAEKFLVAKALARALIAGDARQTQDGFFGHIDGREACVTFADGHICEHAEPEEYNPEWREWRVEDLPVYPPDFRFALVPREAVRLRSVENVLKQAAAVVNACDAAGEGELIFDEIARWCGLYRRDVPVARLWIEDTTSEGLRAAWGRRRPHDDHNLATLRERARARAECDWLWGINLTRAASETLQGQAGLRSRVVSVGRVRSPVLALISARCHEAFEHKPEPYYRGLVEFENEEGQKCEALLVAPPELKFGRRDSDWSDPAQLDIRIRHARMVAGQPWTVKDDGDKPANEYPPAPFDLTDLQRTANRLFQWPARRTERVAQSLYARYKAISYPRTDCYRLPETMRDQVMDLWWRFWRKWLPETHPNAVKLLPEVQPDEGNVFSDDVTDHHAIIPTGVVPPSESDTGGLSDEYRLWDLIVRRFVTAWLPPAQVIACSRVFEIEYEAGEHLRALVTAAPVREPGFLLFEDLTGTTRGFERKLAYRLADRVLPDMKGRARFVRATRKRLLTHAPELFSYDTLLYKMESLKLGTPATRGALLEELVALGQLQENDRQRLVVTEEGERIISLLQAHGGEQVLDQKLTAFWEKQLDRIGRRGESGRTRGQVLEDLVVQITDVIAKLTAPALVEDVVFCPKTGLRVTENEAGWVFAGWSDVACPRVLLSRQMKASDYRDILDAGRKGAGPYEFVSRTTNNPFKAWLRFDKKENRFKFVFKTRDTS